MEVAPFAVVTSCFSKRNRRQEADCRMVCPLAKVPGAGSPAILICARESTMMAGGLYLSGQAASKTKPRRAASREESAAG